MERRTVATNERVTPGILKKLFRSLLFASGLAVASLGFQSCQNPLTPIVKPTTQTTGIDTTAITQAGFVFVSSGYLFKGEDNYLVKKDSNYFLWSPSLKQIVSAGFNNIEQYIFHRDGYENNYVKYPIFKGVPCYVVNNIVNNVLVYNFLSSVDGTVLSDGFSELFNYGSYKGTDHYVIKKDNKYYFVSATTGDTTLDDYKRIAFSAVRFKNIPCYEVIQQDGKWYFLSTIDGTIVSDGYFSGSLDVYQNTFKGETVFRVRASDAKWYFLSSTTGLIVSAGFDQFYYKDYAWHADTLLYKGEDAYKVKKDNQWYFLGKNSGALSDGFDLIGSAVYDYNGEKYYCVQKSSKSYFLSQTSGILIDNYEYWKAKITGEYKPRFLAAANTGDQVKIIQEGINKYTDIVAQNPDLLDGFTSTVGNATLVYGVDVAYGKYMPKIHLVAANGVITTPIICVRAVTTFTVNGTVYLKVKGYYAGHRDSWYEGDFYINTETGVSLAAANASGGIRRVSGRLIVESEFNEFWSIGSHGSSFYDLCTGALVSTDQYSSAYSSSVEIDIATENNIVN